MKVPDRTVIQEAARATAKSDDSSNSHAVSFARQLRSLGQAIEKFKLAAFEIELTGGIYSVRGRLTYPEQKASFFRSVSERLRSAGRRRTSAPSAGQIDLYFMPEDIERFDMRGKITRQDPSKQPDPYGISQILRGVGSYLDTRHGITLTGISLKGKWVTINYRTAEGRSERVQQDLEYFYDYWVKMYLRRSNRPKPLPPSDPTVLITWQGIQKPRLLTS